MTLRHTLRTYLRTAALSALLFSGLVAGLSIAPITHASALTGGLSYRPGYSVQGSWLCYGWSNGTYHCTTHWRVSGGRYVSLNSPWVPSQGSGSAPVSRPASQPATKSAPQPAPSSANSAVNFCGGQAVDFSNASQWAIPRGCYARIITPNPANFPARPSFGWCNWVSEEAHLNFTGYAALYQPKHYGQPRVGAVVWFAPGDQGASSEGHWANLVAIGPNGWGLVVEMNFYFRGGGFAKVDYRFIRLSAPGTAYLY